MLLLLLPFSLIDLRAVVGVRVEPLVVLLASAEVESDLGRGDGWWLVR